MTNLLTCSRDGKCHSVDFMELPHLLGKDSESIFWLDLPEPTEEIGKLLQEQMHIHPAIITDILREPRRPRIELYEHEVFICFAALSDAPSGAEPKVQLFHILIGERYIITLYTAGILPVNETMARWRQSRKESSDNTIAALLYTLLDSVTDDYFPVIDTLADKIDEAENTIFSTEDPDTIRDVFELKKALLVLRRTVAPERDVMNVLLRGDALFMRPSDRLYMQDVYDHIVRLTDTLDFYRDMVSNLLDSYLSLQSNRLNQIVKVLTVASVILMSDALVAGIYGMNFEFMPEIHTALGYPFALGLMVVISLGLIWFFRYRRWL